MTLNDIDNLSLMLWDVRWFSLGGYDDAYLGLEHKEQGLFMRCTSTDHLVARSPAIFKTPWYLPKVPSAQVPVSGWSFLEDQPCFDKRFNSLRDFREKLSAFEEAVREYQMKPRLSGCDEYGGPCLLAFTATDSNVTLVYRRDGTRYTLSCYPGNVDTSACSRYFLHSRDGCGHKYKIVSDVGSLIMKESIGLDRAEMSLYKLADYVNECKSRQ